MNPAVRPLLVSVAALVALLLLAPAPIRAAEGEMRWGLHVTLAARWLDPAETEAFNTPYMVMYAVHDALVKPMAAGMTSPSLAESWQESRDHLTYTFALALQSQLQTVGIRSRLRTMERAAYFSAWRDKKLHGIILVITASMGNAATRLEPYAIKNGIYAYGSLPPVDDLYARQAREVDPKKREAMVHQIQKMIAEHVMHVPLYELGFIWGVGPRVEVPGANIIPGFAYSAPFEDLKLKP